MKHTNFTQFRALLAYLDLGLAAAALELGISRTLTADLLKGKVIPDADLAERIERMSERWPHGAIRRDDWPKPGTDRRTAPLARVSGGQR